MKRFRVKMDTANWAFFPAIGYLHRVRSFVFEWLCFYCAFCIGKSDYSFLEKSDSPSIEEEMAEEQSAKVQLTEETNPWTQHQK